MKKKFLLIGLILLGVLFSGCPNPHDNGTGNAIGKGSIVLKVPVTMLEDPSDIFSNRTITGYTDQNIKAGMEFLIDPSNINNGLCAPKIKFRLDNADENSIVLSITEQQVMSGEMIPQTWMYRQTIIDGNCIFVNPMCTDTSVEYCFELKKNPAGTIELYYSAEQRGVWPVGPGTLGEFCLTRGDCDSGQACYAKACVLEECGPLAPDCPSGKVCVSGVCKNRQELVQDGIACESPGELCTGSCKFCKTGKESCFTEENENASVNACLQCNSDSDCKEGYECDKAYNFCQPQRTCNGNSNC
ncbi:MAG: hypothetical protein PHH08_04135 [Candidatus ainarchaeum sp.]|nr:hypothetical protein [Candidatus ainarchaeum sp.]